ncbi:MAG: site-specific DNA-methyltransferase, partial [Clostridia bacterium]|nr:site-specific DNA-methyltransferase [Clostridia bacterium]
MDKLKMMSMDKVQENIQKIRELFPNAVTEVKRGEDVILAVDFNVLKQLLANTLIDERELRYQFTWPDKQRAMLNANTPIDKTLRPVKNDEITPTGKDSNGNPYCSTGSVDFDNTQNLYIEGDNLDVLKLLQETYLGKIKMIYIDPPYNTGNDFVYNDDFAQDSDKY